MFAQRTRALGVRPLIAALALFVAVTPTFVAAPAWAQDKVDQLAQQLKTSDDFRVRTQAALALGASKSKRALEPLCGGLSDPNTTVRAAAAAAFGKLALGGQQCLEARLAEESSSTVKAAIKKALAKLAGGAEPAFTEQTKFYIAIGKTKDKTGRDGIDALVRKGMAAGAKDKPEALLAPSGETEAKAKERLAKRKGVKGFMLAVTVDAPTYAGGALTVKIGVAIFTYPGLVLKGTSTLKLSQPDTESGDTAAEDELITDACSRAMGNFLAKASRID